MAVLLLYFLGYDQKTMGSSFDNSFLFQGFLQYQQQIEAAVHGETGELPLDDTGKPYEGKKIKISVFDEGEIIPQEDGAMVFDRFYKSDKSRGLDKSGVGLGLYICKTIIDAHGENIYHEPHDDGCEFWFTLKEGDPSNINKYKVQ